MSGDCEKKTSLNHFLKKIETQVSIWTKPRSNFQPNN
jgi:hypothetical protein